MFDITQNVWRFTVLVVMLCLSIPVYSADNLIFEQTQIAELLGQKGEWIVERWEQRMGAAEQCDAGASYVFNSDSTLKFNIHAQRTWNCSNPLKGGLGD